MTAQQYRVRLFEGGYQLLSGRTFMTTFDLKETGHGAVRQGSSLDALLWNMVEIARAEDSAVDPTRVRLVLCDPANDRDPVFEWVSRS